MANPMQRALAIALVQADENVALRGALGIANPRRDIAAANDNHERRQRTFAMVTDGQRSAGLTATRARVR